MSQKELARRLGVGQTTIANYEGNLRFPDRSRLITLAQLLSIPIDTLVGTANGNIGRDTPVGPHEIMHLLLSGQQERAWGIINAAFISGKNQTAIQDEILIPLLHFAGDLWNSGEINIAGEHVISNAVDDFLERLRVPMTRTSLSSPLVLCCTFPGEAHILGLKMLRNRLNEEGWQTVFSGASVPEKDLLQFLQQIKGDVIILSATIKREPAEVISLTEKIHNLEGFRNTPVIIGGQGLTGMKNEPVPGSCTWYTESLQEVLEKVSRLMQKQEKAG